MLDYWEFATKLRNLAREIKDPEVYMPLVHLAEEYESRAETLEMQQIVQAQRDWVETHG